MNVKLYNGQTVARFWKKVSKRHPDECWNWIAAKNPNGYGHMTIMRKTISAHRISWELEHGQIPSGMSVLHKCDNRKCVNPDHLFLGTNLDNTKDMYSKNRQAIFRGENNPRCKLRDGDVIEIRNRALAGECKHQIAKDFQISHFYVYDLLNNRRRQASEGTIS